MDNNTHENLNKLENKLYSRKSPLIIDKGRSEFEKTQEDNTNSNWGQSQSNRFDELAYKFSKTTENKHGFIKKFFVGSAIFFVLSALVALFVFFGGSNLISSENVDIKILSPLSVGAGQEVSFDMTVLNNNNTALEAVSVLIEYPDGTYSSSDPNKELTNERFTIGTIEAGESYTQKIYAVFFGEKESIKQINISLEYRIENSSATFFKEKVHELSISSSPVILTPVYPREVNSNQDITLSIEVTSNSKEPLSDLLVKVEYPFGFVYKNSSITPSANKDTWTIPTLKSGESKTINIQGTIVGQDNEERSFRIYSGTKSEDDDRQISVILTELTETILVKKPFLGLNIFMEGSSQDYAARGGQDVDIKFNIRNNLPSRIFNLMAEAVLEGGALDKNQVSAGSGGFFRSIDNTVLWDGRSSGVLRDLGPGEEVTLSFRVTPLQYEKISRSLRPEINISYKVNGERVLESGSVEQVTSTENRKIILATNLDITSKVVRSMGSIENNGPIPPQAEKPTTYTVVWGITNTFNQASSVEARATLPHYVRFTGVKYPNDNNIIYNPISNEVVWNAGTVLQNTGFGGSPKEVYFQIEIVPSTSQIGTSPRLVGEVTLVGKDRVTNADIADTASAVTTNFSGDSSYRVGDDKVVP